jgi:PAS domain S-box-containing protein
MIKDAENKGIKNEEMISSLALVTELLLSNHDFIYAIDECIMSIRRVIGSDRIYLYVSCRNADKKVVFVRKSQWEAGLDGDTGFISMQNPHSEDLIVEFLKDLALKRSIIAVPEYMPDDSELKNKLSKHGIKSLLINPVFRGDNIWGYIGCEEIGYSRSWSEVEISFLKSFCNILTIALERSGKQTEIEKLSLVARKNRMGIMIFNSDYEIAYVNEALQRMTGYTRDELIGNLSYSLLTGISSKQKNIDVLENSYQKSYPVDIDLKLYRKDRTWFWANVKQQPLGEKNLGENNSFSFIQDISERKLAEENVRNSHRRLTALIQNLKEGILLEDENHRIAFVNQSFCTMFNIDTAPSDLASMDYNTVKLQIRKLLNQPDEFFKRDERLIADGEIVLEEELILLSNQVYERDYIPIFKNDEVKGHLWKYTDITTRKNQEKILRRQEEKYRNIIANMKMGLLEVDIENNIRYANQQFAEMSGYSMMELTGKKVRDLNISEQFEKILSVEEDTTQESLTEISQMEVNTRKGNVCWWLVTRGPNFNDKGKLIGSVLISVDITQQKMLEMELEVARMQAEESSNAKEAFLANMSHEIRTPLNVIIGMIREISRESLSPAQNVYIKNAATSSQHLLSIVNNILDITKIESGQLDIVHRPFSLAEIIEETYIIIEPSANEKMLKISTTISEKVNHLYIGDPNRIRQVLLNILNNSVKFTDEGSISINCQVDEESENEHSINITISDTGIGMDETFLKNIFERFTQSDFSAARKYGGTGLGMAISYELVRMMNGHINIRSKPGQGTSVVILLRLEVCKDTLSSIRKDQEDFNGLRNKKILLVEDNYLNRMVATNSLSYYGINVKEAINGLEAIEILKESSFDIILMDLQMPTMGGLESTKYIRSNLGLETPIIALTANAFKSEIERCIEAGINDYIIKPFEERILLSTILKNLSSSEPTADITELPTSAATEKLYDLGYIIELSRGNKDFVRKMINVFCEQIPDFTSQMMKAWQSGDYITMKKVAHLIKPSLANFRIISLSDNIKAIEGFDETMEQDDNIESQIYQVIDITGKVAYLLQSDVSFEIL